MFSPKSSGFKTSSHSSSTALFPRFVFSRISRPFFLSTSWRCSVLCLLFIFHSSSPSFSLLPWLPLRRYLGTPGLPIRAFGVPNPSFLIVLLAGLMGHPAPNRTVPCYLLQWWFFFSPCPLEVLEESSPTPTCRVLSRRGQWCISLWSQSSHFAF